MVAQLSINKDRKLQGLKLLIFPKALMAHGFQASVLPEFC